MAIIDGWCPPTRAHWEQLVFLWQFFPLLTSYQWLFSYYPMGKTSAPSRFNIPGKIGWATMEAPGFITLLYLMFTLPAQQGLQSLPWPNWLMAGLFSCHYVYRALIGPLLNPSMSPIHVLVWAAALSFQLINSTSIGGWLAGYGPTTLQDWRGSAPQTALPRIEVGLMIWAIGLMSNIYHDDELREIRRVAARSQDKKAKGGQEGKSVDKVYQIPQNGLFRIILYPHFFSEWIEWAGFWMVGGLGCIPARTFLINEIATMLPRAMQGRRWYIERFGEKRIGNRKAVVPWVV